MGFLLSSSFELQMLKGEHGLAGFSGLLRLEGSPTGLRSKGWDDEEPSVVLLDPPGFP
jgi:hypothetical protein